MTDHEMTLAKRAAARYLPAEYVPPAVLHPGIYPKGGGYRTTINGKRLTFATLEKAIQARKDQSR